MWMMDEDVLKNNLDDIDKFVDGFDGGKYPMLVKQQNIANCDFCSKDLDIQFINWKIKNDKWWNYRLQKDFVIQNWELKIWKWHSYISNWKNVEFAWELKFNTKWELIEYSNGSWHYLLINVDRKKLIELLNRKNINTFWLKFIDRTFEFK